MNLGAVDPNVAAGWHVADDGTIWAPANNVPDTPAVLAPVEVTDRAPWVVGLAILALIVYLAATTSTEGYGDE